MADHTLTAPGRPAFPKGPAGQLLSRRDRPVSATAARALASEATRHPGPKTVLVVGDADGVLDRVLRAARPSDHLVLVPNEQTGSAADTDATAALLAWATERAPHLKDRLTVLAQLPTDPAALPAPVDVAVVGRPVHHPAVVDLIRPLLAVDGVLSVSCDATAGDPLADLVGDHGVRTEYVFRSAPPLRVHHLRFTPATPHLAERLAPARTTSHVAVTGRMGLDSNGVFGAVALAGAAVLTKVVARRSKLWLLPAVAALPVAAFFRDPRRTTPQDNDTVVAPADGRVLSVERLTDERFGTGEWLRVAVFLSVLDVHINRSPVAGRVVAITREEGGYANAMTAAAEHNVACYTVLETVHGRVVVAQRSGLIARRIVNRAAVGSLLARGERYGLIRFGSRTDVYLPADAAEALVTPGDRVIGGETVLAHWQP